MEQPHALPEKYRRLERPLTWLVVGVLLALPVVQSSGASEFWTKGVVGMHGAALLALLAVYVRAGVLRLGFVLALVAAVASGYMLGQASGQP